MRDLWPDVKSLLPLVQHPVRYIDHEYGACHRTPDDDPDDTSFCMVYPDTYELGQANQAVRILVNCINAHDHMFAERAYVPAPDFIDLMRTHKLPLFSMESCAPLCDFDIVGITLPHELAATNVLEALDLAQIPLHSADRTLQDPFVIAGGPCTYNPEPYAPFFDAMCIGEGEEQIVEVTSAIRNGKQSHATRAEILEHLADIDGIYVPSFYTENDAATAQKTGYALRPINPHAKQVITKRIWDGFADSPAWEPCIVPYAELVHDRLSVEILRGCARGCRFCQAGMTYRPVRERSADNIVESALTGLKKTGYDEVSLTSLSSTDHSQIREILTRLNNALDGTGTRVSIPSQRLDAFGIGMADLVAGKKRGGLTFAIEAGTQRLRDVINKNVTEDDIFSSVDQAFHAGWHRCKLYFMIGLPTETDDDVRGIADITERVYKAAQKAIEPRQRGRLKVGISLAVFVPKSQTPFQWDGQISPEEAQRRINIVRDAITIRGIDVSWHDPRSSFIEAVMSRGGRQCARLVEQAWKDGARFDAWREYFDEASWRRAGEEIGIDLDAIAQKTFAFDDVLPWSHISSGVHTQFLKVERKRANRAQTTPDCTFSGCTGCGLCTDRGIDFVTQEVRHG